MVWPHQDPCAVGTDAPLFCLGSTSLLFGTYLLTGLRFQCLLGFTNRFQPLLGRPRIAHGSVFGGVRLHLRAINRYLPQLHQPSALRQLHTLNEQLPLARPLRLYHL